jgi:hypothetical protein
MKYRLHRFREVAAAATSRQCCVHIHTRRVMGNQVLALDPAGGNDYSARDCPVTRISQKDLRALPSVFFGMSPGGENAW